jgi:hypothetical protein
MEGRGYITAGWWGYFFCAAIYVISGLRAGDWLGLAGSVFFLIATVCFMIPHHRFGAKLRERSDD